VVTEALESLLVMLSPIAPFITDELWHRLGHTDFVHDQRWPDFDESLLVADIVQIPVQVNGKVRGTIEVSAGATQADADSAARAEANVARYVDDGEVVKTIWVPDRLLNYVVR